MNWRLWLYCDDSGTHGAAAFYLAALRCTKRRAEILTQACQRVRTEHGLGREMKWAKVSNGYLAAYAAWVSVFLDDRYARMLIMRRKGKRPRSPGELADIYRRFLKIATPPTWGNQVYFDQTDAMRRSAWNSISFRVNKGRQDDWWVKGRSIRLEPVRSHDVDLIQLVDVVLGAIQAPNPSSPAKRALRAMVTDAVCYAPFESRAYDQKIWLFDDPKD
jgi:hypothetical protein